jgi:hypothetical protein
VGYASRYSGLFYVEVSQARVFQSDLKTDGDATMGGSRGTIVEIVRMKLKTDESMRRAASPFYPTFAVFIVLCHKSIVVF